MFKAFGHETRYYDAFHQDKDYAAEAAALRKKYPTAKKVLEVGAGTGLLTRELIKVGFDVFALEPSEEMIESFRANNPGKRPVISTIQQLSGIPVRWFDLTVAHYDVLNYVPFREINDVMQKLRQISAEQDIEIWDHTQGVRFFSRKRAGKLQRFRFAFRFGRRVKLFFVYTGAGLCVAKHNLFLHKRLSDG